jgi:hypothetical protein
VNGVRNTAEVALAAGVHRLVHCSSVHAYDLEAVERVTEDSPRATAAGLPVQPRRPALLLHTQESPRVDADLIAVSCGALPFTSSPRRTRW